MCSNFVRRIQQHVAFVQLCDNAVHGEFKGMHLPYNDFCDMDDNIKAANFVNMALS